VSEFLDRLAAKRAATAEANWMICQCQEGIDPPAGWYVGVVHDPRGPIVAELLCMACEASSSVLNGRPEPDDDE
jgi:hypothetical protein